MSKPYAFGLIVGRFQTIHLGHTDMIGKALSLCDRVGIFVGSSQEQGTEKNPYSYELRKELLSRIYKDSVEIRPLPDRGLGNNGLWGDYVLEQSEIAFGRLPDLIVSGKEARRESWYDRGKGLTIAELSVPKTVDISASRLRSFYVSDDYESWKSFVRPELYPRYPLLRDIYLSCRDKTETASI